MPETGTDPPSAPRRSRRERRRRERLGRSVAAGAAAGLLAAAALSAAGLAIAAAGRDRTAREEAVSRPASATVGATASVPATLSVEPTPSVEPSPAVPPTITVAAVGDMIFDRNVKALIRAEGGEAPLARVAEHLSAADFTCGNLESPLSDGGTRFKGKEVCFQGDPRGAEGLAAAGFDALSLANNHALDYGAEALTDTIEALDARRIAHAGAGASERAAWAPATAQAGSATVAYLAFSHVLPPGFVARDAHPGIAQGRANTARVAAAVRAAKARYDYVVVSFHWGAEYTPYANAEQVRDAHSAVDAGADLVLAHHPHVIQGLERYRNGLIAYSLGDFVFDHYSRETGEAFVLDVELGPHGAGDATVTPVYLDRYGRPEVVTGSAASAILTRLAGVSAKRGARIAVDGDLARVAR